MGRTALIAVTLLARANAARTQQPPLWPEMSGLLQERCIHCLAREFALLWLDLTSHARLMAGSWNEPMVEVAAPGNAASASAQTASSSSTASFVTASKEKMPSATQGSYMCPRQTG